MNKEIEKFSSLSGDWWIKDGGAFKILHAINDLRTNYILKIIKNSVFDHTRISILDVGCGGGILTEKIAENGYNIVGIDPSKSSIEEAKIHSQHQNASYFHLGVEAINEKFPEKFDVVMIMEVLEHVEDLESFLENCIRSLKNSGILFFSTINRTKKSFIFAILIAEYLAKVLPKGTHSWKKFVQPSQLSQVFSKHKLFINNLQGITYNSLCGQWYISDNLDVNYIGFASFCFNVSCI